MSRENNQMAYIAEITHLVPIRDADAIEKAVINAGWPVVVKKGEFEVGAKVLYFEIDSWVPTELAPFLSKGKEPREYNGVKGERLRTIRLRKQLSQGLVLPLQKKMGGWLLPMPYDQTCMSKGDCVGDILGVQKWEAPETFANGQAKGNFPSLCPKTDAERCVSGDTKIVTTSGVMSICDLSDDNLPEVLSYNHTTENTEFEQITAVSRSIKKKKWIKITTETGKVLTCTDDHKIWSAELQCYREAKHFFVGDAIICSEN